MNFVFELQKDKPLREGELFQPFKLVSLWDMFIPCPKTFIAIHMQLSGLALAIDLTKNQGKIDMSFYAM